MGVRLSLAICILGLCGPAPALAADHGAIADPARAVRDRPVAIDVLANDPGVSARTVMWIATRPAHGTATVQGREIVYTPTAGFVGRDTLRYLVKTGRRVGLATVTVDVAPAQLTLAGRVTEGGADAQVSAVSGRLRFMAQANAAGDYVLPMAGYDDDMVRLQSRRGQVALASIVGSFGRLRGESGADAILSRDENAQVQVTRLATSLAYLLQLAGNGAPILGEQQLDDARAAIDSDVLLQMAAAIDLVAGHGYPLPPGIADTLELISDTDAYRQFVADVAASDPQALQEAVAQILADPEVLPPTGRDAFVGDWTMILSSASGTIRVGVVYAERVSLHDDGGGQYADTTAAPLTAVDWTFVDGEARATLLPPRREEYELFRDGTFVRLIHLIDRVDLVRLVDGGSGRHVVGARYHQREILADPPYTERSYVTNATRQAHAPGFPGLPFPASEFPGAHALPIHRPEIFGAGVAESSLTAANFGIHTFSADGTGTVDDGQAFNWSLGPDGRLSLGYSDGETVDMTRLHVDGLKGVGILAEYLLPGGRSKVAYSLASARDGSLSFTPGVLTGPWRSGFDVSQTAYDFAPFYGFYLVLDAIGTGSYVSISETGSTTTPLRWDIVNGVMVARQFSGTQVSRERRWIPVSRSGDRIYVHEELWADPDLGGPLPMLLQSQRANFYDSEAPPAAVRQPLVPRSAPGGVRGR